MVLKAQQDRMKQILKEIVPFLCKNGLDFSSECCVEALIGITLDKDEVLLVNINETLSPGEVNKHTDAIYKHVEGNGSKYCWNGKRRHCQPGLHASTIDGYTVVGQSEDEYGIKRIKKAVETPSNAINLPLVTTQSKKSKFSSANAADEQCDAIDLTVGEAYSTERNLFSTTTCDPQYSKNSLAMVEKDLVETKCSAINTTCDGQCDIINSPVGKAKYPKLNPTSNISCEMQPDRISFLIEKTEPPEQTRSSLNVYNTEFNRIDSERYSCLPSRSGRVDSLIVKASSETNTPSISSCDSSSKQDPDPSLTYNTKSLPLLLPLRDFLANREAARQGSSNDGSAATSVTVENHQENTGQSSRPRFYKRHNNASPSLYRQAASYIRHDKEKLWSCTLCKKEFSADKYAKHHVEFVHLSTNNLRCKYCSYAAKRKPDLKKHEESFCKVRRTENDEIDVLT